MTTHGRPELPISTSSYLSHEHWLVIRVFWRAGESVADMAMATGLQPITVAKAIEGALGIEEAANWHHVLYGSSSFAAAMRAMLR
jgi:hypothetical protein